MIPKASGVGQRPLGIPTIRDRVVQAAAVLVLDPIFEADFDEAAYGYRPKRSALEAVRQVSRAIDEGHTEVVDADLSQEDGLAAGNDLLVKSNDLQCEVRGAFVLTASLIGGRANPL